MGLSLYNIKKWIRMVSGTSIEHVNQGKGRIYSTKNIKGYYNDLTEKIIRDKFYQNVKIPTLKVESGEEIIFPISVFQYGLGAYDLYLIEKKSIFLEIFKLCVNWTYENQQEDGSWKNFEYSQPESPYSSMAQGEATSLLIRAYEEFKEEKYFISARKSVNFMLKPIEDGGTTLYTSELVFLKEFTNRPVVLNGWIFSLFGIYDYLKVDDDIRIKDIYIKSLNTLINNLHKFDNGYWSKYDIENMIASPFYHKLHIAQLQAMYDITQKEIFNEYAEKWQKYELNKFKKSKAFLFKAAQKIFN